MVDFTKGSDGAAVWIGASEIASEILGEASPRNVRRVRWLHESNRLPTFKIGRNVCLRPATWRQYIAEREAEAEALREEARSDTEAA